MVIHILKYGERVEDIAGHIVRKEDAPTVYHIINELKERLRKEDEQ